MRKAILFMGIVVTGLYLLIVLSSHQLESKRYFQIEEVLDISANSPCKWPPNIPTAEELAEGGFNITICARLKRDAVKKQKPKLYRFSDLFRGGHLSRIVSFEDLSRIPRRIWRLVKYPQVYQTYPQDVPIRQIVEAVKAGHPVSHMPQYNFPIRILKTSKSVCARNTKHDLVIVVKSINVGWDARSAFRAYMQRETARYPKLNVGVVFSLAMPRKHGGRIFNRDGNIFILPGTSGDLLEQYDGESDLVMERINQEIDDHDDIVLADFEDTYFNLTWKTVTNLRWLSAFCNKHHGNAFMIMDDDHRMNLSLVEEFLESVSVETMRKSIFGYITKHDRIFRFPTKKFFMSYREFPWDCLSQYPRGFSQFIGADVIDDMAIASAYTRYNYSPEDVFLGMVAFKLGIDLHNVESMSYQLWYKKNRSPTGPVMVAPTEYFDEHPLLNW